MGEKGEADKRIVGDGGGERQKFEVSALDMARMVRALSDDARALTLSIPGFRSPPRLATNRTIRRTRAGGSVVAVTIRGRTPSEVWADLVEGLLAANGVDLVQAARLRAVLIPAMPELTETDPKVKDIRHLDAA